MKKSKSKKYTEPFISAKDANCSPAIMNTRQWKEINKAIDKLNKQWAKLIN